MSPDRFRLLIDRVGFPSHVEAARFLGIEARMFRRMTSGKQDIPHAVALVLEIMAAYEIKPSYFDNWKWD